MRVIGFEILKNGFFSPFLLKKRPLLFKYPTARSSQMPIQKYKSIVAVLSISLILGNAAPQPAMADNLPADTAYSEGINQHYNLEFIPAQTKFNAIYIEPAGTSKRTGAKYKSWLKKVNASSNKIYQALFKLGN
jgi:hypothetical protein